MIEITSVTPPEVGWPIVCYCPLCKETTIVLSLWAIKPERGDYWHIDEMCLHEVLNHKHGIELAMSKNRANRL